MPSIDYDELLAHRGHDLTIKGEQPEVNALPIVVYLVCKSCENRTVLAAGLTRSFEDRECEWPDCQVILPREDMVQLPGGEYFCPPHARDAERMP